MRYNTKLGWMNLKELFADVAIISMSVSLLWHFSNIWRYGQYLIGEPNLAIRILETAWFLTILAFGVGKCISDLKKVKR